MKHPASLFGTMLLAAATGLGACTAPAAIKKAPVPEIRAAGPAKESQQALYLSIIEKLIAADKCFAALAHIEEYERQFGGTPASRKLAGDAWFRVGRPAQAQEQYRKLSATPLAAEGEHGLGLIALEKQDWGAAAAHFKKAAHAQPTNAAFLNQLGGSLIELADFDAAEIALRKAYDLDPANPRIEENLLRFLALTGRADRFDEIFKSNAGVENRARLRVRLQQQMEMNAREADAVAEKTIVSFADGDAGEAP